MSLCDKIFARQGNALQVTSQGFQTGHEPVHRSKSGTCVDIDVTKDVWYCRSPSCQEGGGAIKALMSLEGKSYAEAEAEVLAMGGTVKRSPPQLASFFLTEKGKPRPLLCNLLEVLNYDPGCSDMLHFNTFTGMVEVHTLPPCYPAGTPWTVQPLQECHASEMTAWIQDVYEVCTASTTVYEALVTYAHRFPYHPVQDYLTGLVWDGTARLDTWLTTYCGVEDTAYSQAVGAATLIGAVARIMQPGCKMDTALILQGPQGRLKSTVWRVLASDPWFTDALPDLHTKDAALALVGKWIIEFADLDNLKRADIETVKRFISATQDHYRPPYGRLARTVLRSNIFVGTTNKECIFVDDTGNRRFWPVTTTGVCDIAQLEADRDQLWAEALARYRQYAAWYLTDPTLVHASEVEQDARMEVDAWTDAVLTYLDTTTRRRVSYNCQEVEFVTTHEILEQALELDKSQWHSHASRRVAAILRLARWKYARVDNPDTECARRQLKGFVPESDESDTVPNQNSSGSPHKTYSESDKSDESDRREKHERQEKQEPTEERIQTPLFTDTRVYRKVSNSSGSSDSSPLHATDSRPCAEPDVLGDRTHPMDRTQASDSATAAPSPSVTVGACADIPPVEYLTTARRLEEVLPTLQQEPLIGLDLETVGLDPLTGHIRLVQLATLSQTLVIDAHHVPVQLLAPLFTQAHTTFAGHNLKFDLKYLVTAGLPWPAVVEDTMLLAQLLGASGETRPKGYYALGDVVERTLGQQLDKFHQTDDWSGPLSSERLLYAARDAAVLIPLVVALRQANRSAGLEAVRAIEAACLPAVSWLELAGVLVDEAAWQALAQLEAHRALALEAALSALLHARCNGAGIPHRHRVKKQDILESLQPEQINWGSTQQVRSVLTFLGHQVDGTGEAILTHLALTEPLAARLLEHRAARQQMKLVGAEWLREHVHAITHRVHGDYRQLGSRAGRMSCSKPNMQQIPRSDLYRKNIIAAPGQALVKADYSQIELRLAAAMAPEPVMLEAFQAGADLHRLTASAVLGLSPDAVTPEHRALGKTLNFAMIYGAGRTRLREQVFRDTGVAYTEAQIERRRHAFFQRYPGLARWQHETKQHLHTAGSVETRTLTGRRRLGLTRLTDIYNTPVQGTGADGLKLALARLFAHRHEVPDARLILCVHDEIVAECPQEQAAATAHWLTTHMEAAMAEIVHGAVPIAVETTIGRDWAGTPLQALP